MKDEEDLKKSIEELVEKKTALEKRIFELEKENEDLKNQIKGFENDFDYQNKIIDKYKEDLKKLRVAYIQAQDANVISGTDFESILKSVLNGENLNGKIVEIISDICKVICLLCLTFYSVLGTICIIAKLIK